MESPSGSTLVSVLGALEIGLIGAVAYFLSQLVGNTDTSNDLVKTVIPVTATLGGIVLLHTAMWYLYFTYNPASMNLYFLVVTAFCMIVSLTSLSIAITNRS